MRLVVEFVLLLVVATLMGRTWLVQAHVVPTGSMANAIRGVHRHLDCADCGFAFDVGSGPEDQLPSFEPRALCPNCYATNPLEELPDREGDRLLVQRGAFWLRTPQRWEVAVFQDPRLASRRMVKRVVGLPGETIAIRQGNVFIDGQLARKSLDVQRGMAILVHDSAFRPRNDSLPQRWRPEAANSGWSVAEQRFSIASQRADYDWLAYRHWKRWPGLPNQVVECAIDDTCGYNQGVPLESYSEVDEVLLQARLTMRGTGDLAVRVEIEDAEFSLRLEPATGRAALLRDSEVIATTQVARLADRDVELELSTIDRQIICALDGQELFAPVLLSDRNRRPSEVQLAIGVRKLEVQVEQLRLSRDVVYTHPRGPGPHWALDADYTLGDGELYVLGDNSCVSLDSRLWTDSPAVNQQWLIGKPMRVIGRDRLECLLARLGL